MCLGPYHDVGGGRDSGKLVYQNMKLFLFVFQENLQEKVQSKNAKLEIT